MQLRFGPEGWFAVQAEGFTYAALHHAVQAMARYLKAHDLAGRGVVVAHDTRFQASDFSRSVVEVLAGAEIRSFYIEDDLPAPAVASAVKARGAAAGLMISGGHREPRMLGLRIFNQHGAPADSAMLAEIEENLSLVAPDEKVFTVGFDTAEESNLLDFINPREEYARQLRELVDFEAIRRNPPRIVFDPLYGSARNTLDSLLAAEGVQVRVLHNYRDPLFGGSAPDAGGDGLRALRQAVEGGKADLGLAVDGDGSRFAAVDSLGNVITPNEALVVLLHHLITRRKLTGKAIRTVATTHLFDHIGRKHGIEVLEVPVGFQSIAPHMVKDDIILGGEESGGVSILGHVPAADGILGALLLTELAAVEGKPLTTVVADLLAEIGELYSRRVDLRFRDTERRYSILETLKRESPGYIAGLKVVDRYEIDGLKFILNDGSWVLVRPSVSEPVLRVYLEGTSRDVLRRLERFADELVR